MHSQRQLAFTRYLYIKDEVELMIVSCILERSEQALFWTYELYHSGYRNDVIMLLWKIYYDFFASLNPSFEKYLITKFRTLENEAIQNASNVVYEKLIGCVVHNLLIRPHNMDVFMLRQMSLQFDFDFDSDCLRNYSSSKNIYVIQEVLYEFLNNEDYNMIANLVMNIIDYEHLKDILIMTTNFYKLQNIDCKTNVDKMCENFEYTGKKTDPRLITLSKIVLFGSYKKKLKMGKNLFIQFESDELNKFNTIEPVLFERKLMPYKILKTVQLEKIDNYHYLSLFSLDRKNYDIRSIWFSDWLYYASFSPIWNNRIKNHNGIINSELKKIVFKNDDDEETFFDIYNLEPDEQPKNIQDFIIGQICEERNWFKIFDKFQKTSVLNIDEDILNDLSNVLY
jgi:hypothetical protein